MVRGIENYITVIDEQNTKHKSEHKGLGHSDKLW